MNHRPCIRNFCGFFVKLVFVRYLPDEAQYAQQAYTYWQRSGTDKDIYVSWDSTIVPAALLLAADPTAPGRAEYSSWLTSANGFVTCWTTGL